LIPSVEVAKADGGHRTANAFRRSGVIPEHWHNVFGSRLTFSVGEDLGCPRA
jgi:hypothetical protein